MLDPKTLKVGDKVKFISLPEEWKNDNLYVSKESIEFMKIMIKRKNPSRVYEIDEYGSPWVAAKILENGKVVHHAWAITEHSGWRHVTKRD